MASSPSRDQGAPYPQTPRSPREPLSIPITSASYAQNATSTTPMPVPSSSKKSPPPPLPPPRYIDSSKSNTQGLAHRPLEGEGSSVGSASIKSGSSLLGGSSGSAKQYTGPQKNVDFGIGSSGGDGTRSESENPQGEQRMPDLGAVMEYNKLEGEKHLGQRSNERSSVAYDKQVLARIGGPSTPPRSAGALSSSGAGEADPSSPKSFGDFQGALQPLSASDRRSDAAESPRFPTSASALSPNFPNLQSPLSESDSRRRSWSRPGPHPNKNSMEEQIRSPQDENIQAFPNEPEPSVGDESHLSELNINDKRPHSTDEPMTGSKRRAQSPPSSTIDPSLRSTEDMTRRDNPQVARLQGHESGSLASSASSALQNGSYPSSYAFSAGSSATSYSSQRPTSSSQFQQRPDATPATPQEPQTPSSAQPVQSPMGPPASHRRTGSTGIARPPGVFICECCPKKPRKFDNEEELRVHEMEKQYFCQFCHNRFKNKNEAERHQNSLHLRRHSWSCAALQSLEDAFHPTMNSTIPSTSTGSTPGTPQQQPLQQQQQQQPQQQIGNNGRLPSNSDTCGYCGQEFPNPPDWGTRVDHLNHQHKFGECNQSKKFYRADHFRQHLKHSHGGLSGRWTNMLENACMREEPPIQPPGPPQLPMGIAAQAPMGVQMPQMQPGLNLQQAQAQQMTAPQPAMISTQAQSLGPHQGQEMGVLEIQPGVTQQVQQTPSQSLDQQVSSGQSRQTPPPQPQASMPDPSESIPDVSKVEANTPIVPLTEQQAQQTAQQAAQQAAQQSNEDTNQLPTTTPTIDDPTPQS